MLCIPLLARADEAGRLVESGIKALDRAIGHAGDTKRYLLDAAEAKRYFMQACERAPAENGIIGCVKAASLAKGIGSSKEVRQILVPRCNRGMDILCYSLAIFEF